MVLIPKYGVLRPHATGILSDPEACHEIQMDILRCVHCQRSWTVRPGSGKTRGFCLKCMGPLCGHQACFECRGSYEKQCDLWEAGKLDRYPGT